MSCFASTGANASGTMLPTVQSRLLGNAAAGGDLRSPNYHIEYGNRDSAAVPAQRMAINDFVGDPVHLPQIITDGLRQIAMIIASKFKSLGHVRVLVPRHPNLGQAGLEGGKLCRRGD